MDKYYKHTLRYLFVISLMVTVFLALRTPAFAACTSMPQGDLPGWGQTVTLNSCNKTIAEVTGVDYATSEASVTNSSILALTGTSSLTINATGHLTVGTLVINPGTSLSIATGGDIKLNTPIYVPDGDNDGFADSFTFTTATASGKRRLGLMRSSTTIDACAGQYDDSNACCVASTYYVDADGDGRGIGAPITMCPAAGYADNNTDCNDSMSGYRYTLGTRYYKDNDVDTYTLGSQIAGIAICSNASTWDASVNWSAPGNGTTSETFTIGSRRSAASALADCDDANSVIHPNGCNGNTAYNAACATQICTPSTNICETGGTCSNGACAAVTFVANGLAGSGCNTTNYRCDGAGNCTAPTTTTCVSRSGLLTCEEECTTSQGAISCSGSYQSGTCTSAAFGCTIAKPFCSCGVYLYDYNPPGG